VIIRKNIRC